MSANTPANAIFLRRKQKIIKLKSLQDKVKAAEKSLVAKIQTLMSNGGVLIEQGPSVHYEGEKSTILM
jgi:hypothetical protein